MWELFYIEYIIGTMGKKVGFTVDAGLIERLGYELVGRAETAVSELIKNAYDADATRVTVDFINTERPGGTIIIKDNGVGMSESQLLNGFMRISSADKVHNPVSVRFNRTKAGRKGIGRFATQRLGSKLIILTQTEESEQALKLDIYWDEYQMDREISDILFPLELVDKKEIEGTTLIIENVREAWSESAIRRVFRYVSELLQPDYLSDRSREGRTATRSDQYFEVCFYRTAGGERIAIADENRMIFDKALATIIGKVDDVGLGGIRIESDALKLQDDISITPGDGMEAYEHIRNVYFKVYYFIYNREEYYDGKISSLELKNINQIAEVASGVKLYRNGFRVLPYGEPTDDWLAIDRRWQGASGVNIPFANKNFFGFVEIVDTDGILYEETASREGLIDNIPFVELKNFLSTAFKAAHIRLSSAVLTPKKQRQERLSAQKNRTPLEIISNLKEKFNNSNRDNQEEERQEFNADLNELEDVVSASINEINMLRVLAGMGLTIGEFTHEISQFKPAVDGYLYSLAHLNLGDEANDILSKLQVNIDNFTAYTAYFNATVSQNVRRELAPINLKVVINQFLKTIGNDLKRNKIDIDKDFYGVDFYTTPMHISEWSSILFNLYTNAKKAIIRAKTKGNVRIVAGEEDNTIYVEFADNGDGVPEQNKERIFDAFFTTSTPAGFDASTEDQLIGTGIGLKIVKDIILSYKGSIGLIEPETDYKTCFRIEIPKVTNKEKEHYEL